MTQPAEKQIYHQMGETLADVTILAAERDRLKAVNAELVATMTKIISKGCKCSLCNRLNAALAKNKEQAP